MVLKPITVLIYEDNEDMREALSQLITQTKDLKIAGAFSDCMKAETQVKELLPDVIIMDIDMPGISGIKAVELIRRFDTDVQILMLTVFDTNEKIFDALCAGASGYLLKKNIQFRIVDAIKDVHTGGTPLTPEVAKKVLNHFSKQQMKSKEYYHLTTRESDVLYYLAKGYSYKMIATQLSLSIDTIRFHIKQIYFKLQVNSAPEAVSKAIREKIV
jgi:DNA-binding NarL/FixJ family response regulator